MCFESHLLLSSASFHLKTKEPGFRNAMCVCVFFFRYCEDGRFSITCQRIIVALYTIVKELLLYRFFVRIKNRSPLPNFIRILTHIRINNSRKTAVYERTND